MPRRYYKRTRVVRPRKRWATNFKQGRLETGANETAILVENTTQSSSPTPVIVKCGNFKLQGDLSSVSTQGYNTVPRITIVVFFLPQGVELTATTANGILENHPEWILVWKQIDASGVGSGNYVQGSTFSVSSRLKRNLNSGDRVCIGYTNDTAGVVSPTIKFTCQYWTCAN